jgi:pimeloyl-ACP methyl ester carboxylesterase
MGLAYPAAMWFRLVPALAEGYRVIRVDNRGVGRTGEVPGAPYTVESMAADCQALTRRRETFSPGLRSVAWAGSTAAI